MSDNARYHVNELIVDIFNQILTLEERYHTLHGSELSINEIHTIDAIKNSETKQMSDVARDLNITQGTLTTTIKRLENKGFVKRVQDSSDRRIYRLNLEGLALDVLEIHDQFHNEMIEWILSQLGNDEKLIQSIAELNKFFKNLIEDKKIGWNFK